MSESPEAAFGVVDVIKTRLGEPTDILRLEWIRRRCDRKWLEKTGEPKRAKWPRPRLRRHNRVCKVERRTTVQQKARQSINRSMSQSVSEARRVKCQSQTDNYSDGCKLARDYNRPTSTEPIMLWILMKWNTHQEREGVDIQWQRKNHTWVHR